MTWMWFWVLITVIPSAFIAGTAKDVSGLLERFFSFVLLFVLLGFLTGICTFLLSALFEAGEGVGNWWSSQPSASGGPSKSNEVPPFLILIPFFMMMGFLIAKNRN